jgi:hypothetical protein
LPKRRRIGASATSERRRTVQRISSILLRQTWSDEHLKTLGNLLQGIMNRAAVRALRRALRAPTNEETPITARTRRASRLGG